MIIAKEEEEEGTVSINVINRLPFIMELQLSVRWLLQV
jgi:hypothetical protein